MNHPTLMHRWFEEVWNQGRTETIDELLAPDVVGHGLVDAAGQEVRGVAAFKEFYHSFRETFPDIHITVEDTISEGDKLVGRCQVTGCHRGGGIGVAPTGKTVSFGGACIVRIKDGRIAESWNHFDFLSLYQQVGCKVP